jgi:glyoxylase-like metal-dependent hydrolase (beta-lactamase superfamily II)
MWIKQPGKVTERIDFLGTYDMCLYLLKGREAMIIGGGMSYVGPYLEKQLSAVQFDTAKIRYLVIPHSHFDHCGAVPYLKRKLPQLEIVASAYSKEVFSKGKVVNFIAGVNRQMIEKYNLHHEYEELDLRFDGIQIDRVVGDHDIIDLGEGVEAHFIEVPGHSRCCIGTYVPCLEAMFPTDAAPFPMDDEWGLSSPSAQYDFSSYEESLNKLAAHNVGLCAFDHHGVLVGDEAESVLQRGLEEVHKLKTYIVQQYEVTRDPDKIAEQLASQILERSQLQYMSPELMTSITRAMIGSIVRQTPS